jgi:hypothetical protein
MGARAATRSFGVGCMRHWAMHGSTCGHSLGRRVHAARGGRACPVTTEREGTVLAVCEEGEGPHLHVSFVVLVTVERQQLSAGPNFSALHGIEPRMYTPWH